MSDFVPTELYHEFLRNMPLACVDVVAIHEDAFLLVRRADAPARGEWWLPGGRLRKGERLEDAALRKLAEEVGIRGSAGALIHTEQTLFRDGPAGIPVHSLNVCYLVHAESRQVRLDATSADYRWCTWHPPGLHPYVRHCIWQARCAVARAA